MNKACTFLVFAALASGAFGQGALKLDQPLSEASLLEKIDSIGTGDPLKKAPLSAGDTEKKAAEPRNEEKKKDLKGTTEITSKNASFDQKAHQAVFAGEVTVTNPEFKIVCDKLTAFLKNDAKPASKAAAPLKAGSPAPEAVAGKKPKSTGGLERAIAEALEGKRVVITQDKTEADGSIVHYVGKAEKADYNAVSGEVVLTGWPEVQQGFNSSVATQRSTVMYLNRDGRLRTEGDSKIVIKDSGPDQANAR